jgi:hypothetical protein
MRKSVIVIVIGLFLINGVSAEILLNEIMPHTNSQQGIEWVEIYNDDSEDFILENWKIGDLISNDSFSLNISGEDFGLIIDGDQEDCSLFDIPEESCFALGKIGSGLNDGSETIFLYDDSDSLVDSFSWDNDIKSSGNSWSFKDADWEEAIPTPGLVNNEDSGDEDIKLEIDWNDDDIVNGLEFEIELTAENLKGKDYDVKVWIEDDDGNVISDRYDEDNDEWENGRDYVDEFLQGPGDDDRDMTLRIRDQYDDFKGDAVILARIREEGSSSYEEEIEDNIEILEEEPEEDNDDSADEESEDSSSDENDETPDIYEDYQEYIKRKAGMMDSDENSITGNVIRLGSKKQKTENQENPKSENIKTEKVYNSNTETIKTYAIISFAFLCVIMALLLGFNKLK